MSLFEQRRGQPECLGNKMGFDPAGMAKRSSAFFEDVYLASMTLPELLLLPIRRLSLVP